MGLPKRVTIHEVGPREGFQIAEMPISTADKVRLVDALGETGLTSIEVTSFVSPTWVPQMADAQEVLAGIHRAKKVSYRSVYLNVRGLRRACECDVTIDGVLMLTASDTFSKRNTNKSIDETFAALPTWIQAYQDLLIPVDQVLIMAAFGCNFEGEVTQEHVLHVLRQAIRSAQEHGETIRSIKLADTMGWANPEQIRRMVDTIKNEWPEISLMLHLHDTRGLGLANAYAAMLEGVDRFESAVGGLGGCPFAAVRGAAGNLATEDLAFLCREMGVETDIQLDRLLDCVRLAEEIIGHPLPGHLVRGGLVRK